MIELDDYNVNVTGIFPISWSNFKFAVHVAGFIERNGKKFCLSFAHQDYIEETLKKWFGEVEYYWAGANDYVYLCEKR